MPPKLKLTLLGQASIEKGKNRVENLPSRAAEALFIYLARSQKPVSREKLAEFLWADRSPAQALTNLRTVLTALKRELGDHLDIARDTLSFIGGNYWVDVDEFERQLKGMGFLSQPRPLESDADVSALQTALDLYQGDFLEGFHLRDGQGFEEWATLERERLKQLAREGFRALTLHYLETGRHTDALNFVGSWMRLDPYDEEACRAQMWAFLRSGQRSAAIQCYQTLKEKLGQDLGVAPSSATTDQFSQFQALDYPPAINLPTFSAGFIGRQAEMTELAQLLTASATRLVTITAPGGMGKTRLAVEAARAITARAPAQFLHGVYFVPLAATDAVEDIPMRIAETIGFSFHGSEPLQNQLIEYLKERETLLLLDNFEQLFDESQGAMTLLVNLLRGAPQLRLLVTSRERLNLYEEIVFDIGGLETPQDDAENVEDFSAAALFVQSARRLRRDFSVSLDERGHVARICQLVNGMPLAIELASAWMRAYTCQQIAEQIAQDLDFLASPYQDVSAGHRSLRAVFERSWSLLSPQEQTAFARLSVFRGGFTPEAVRAVLAGDAESNLPEDGSAELLLADLADKSLLQRGMDGRWDIHPMLLQYAAEKLSASADHEAVSTSHALYYLDFLTALGDGESPEQRAAIRPERDNIRRAWERAAALGMAERIEATAGILHSFFSAQSWFQEGIELFGDILALFENENATETRGMVCDLLGRKARMHTQIGQLEAARADVQKALAHLDHMDDPARRSRVLDSLAITNYYAGEYLRAAELAGESLRLSEETNNLDGVAFALNFLGSCAKAQGEYEQCREYFERAVKTYEQMQDEIGAAMVLNNLGNLLQAQGDFSAAEEYYLRSSAIFKAQDHLHGAATTLSNAGKLAGKRGEYDLAKRLFTESLEMKRAINDQRGEAVTLAGLGDLNLLLNAYEESRGQLLQALKLAQQANDAQLMLDILTAIADLAVHEGQGDVSHRLLSFVLGHAGLSEEARQRALRLMESAGESPKHIGAWGASPLEDVVAEILQGG